MTKETSIQEEINITSNFSATQGEEYPHPAKQQLHPAKYQLEHIEDEEIQEFFFLITGIDEKNNTCEVISGSFDGLKAGPEDIVLPKSVLGQYVYLSPGIGGTVPTESLGTGFAVLDTPTFDCICKAQNEYKVGKVQPIPSWPQPMRYISDNDDRIGYHNRQKELLQSMQAELQLFKKKFFLFALPFKHFYKAAAVLFVGALVTFCYFTGQHTTATPEKWEPTGTMRGRASEFSVFSPRGEMYSSKPEILIGGNSEEFYTVSVYAGNEPIAEQKVSGKSKIFWSELGLQELEEGKIYSLQIKKGNIVIASKEKNMFWRMEGAQRKEISNLLAAQHKHSFTGRSALMFGVAAATDAASSPEIKFKSAQIFFDKGCYSEAYLIVSLLYDYDKKNREYKKLYERCLEKLEIKEKK